MIEVAQEIITEYMTDSINKELTITGSHTGGQTLNEVNYYTGDIIGDIGNLTCVDSTTGTFNFISIRPSDSSVYWDNDVNWDYVGDHDYISIAMLLGITSSATISNTTGAWSMNYENDAGVYQIASLGQADIQDFINNTSKLKLAFAKPQDGVKSIRSISFTFNVSPTTTFTMYEGKVQVNFLDYLGTPRYYEPTDFTNFIADDYVPYTIDNNNLLYEEFNLTESLCSKDNLKFGLCEAAHCEFSYVDSSFSPRVGDIITPYTNISGSSGITDDDLFAINFTESDPTATKTTSTSLYTRYPVEWDNQDKIISYKDYVGKCLYFQEKIEYTQFTLQTGTMPTYFKYVIYGCKYTSPTSWSITYKTPLNDSFYAVSDYMGDNITSTHQTKVLIDDSFSQFDFLRVGIRFYDSDYNEYTDYSNKILCNRNTSEVQIRYSDDDTRVMPAWTTTDCYYFYGTLEQYIREHILQIPYGVFYISNVSNEYKHNIIKKKITAYDNLLPLENNAADWYTRYMFGVDTNGYNSNGFEYARQIYSTYWSYISELGLDSIKNYDLTTIATYPDSDFIANQNSNYKYIMWQQDNITYYLCYAMKEVQISDTSLLYRITWDNYLGETDEERKAWFSYYPKYVDDLYRGATHNGGVLIEEYKTGEVTPYNCLCVNSGDFFMLSDETAFIRFLLPSGNKTTGFSLCVNVTLESATPREYLNNGNLRLCYYNYSTKDIFACDSSITGRDVVRSLLEVCGCFFRMSRYGLPEFVYPTKNGLYPSNTLYPADDLYPRAGTDLLSTMGKYMSVIAEDYEVTDYGRIQILKKIKSANTESICEWQYEGDPDKENTYIIDDNIFYCADDMLYDYGGMPEVSDMLEGMWNVISNLGYVPNVTQALGAPWIECGDRIGLLTFDGGFETFVFRRTLKGIQNLRDTYESEGDECNEAINNFGY